MGEKFSREPGHLKRGRRDTATTPQAAFFWGTVVAVGVAMFLAGLHVLKLLFHRIAQ